MRWGFVADDLTGACLVGGLLAEAGVASVVMTGPPEPTDAGPDTTEAVVGVNAESRVATTAESFERVRRATSWLEDRGCTHLFKFVDSTLRGHVGSELEAMLAAGSGGRAVVVPGTPSADRTVVGGRLLVDGAPANASPHVANEVLSPLASDRVVELFRQSSTLRFAAVGEEVRPLGIEFDDHLAEAIVRHLAAGTVPITDAPDTAAIEGVLRLLVDRDLLTGLDVLCGSAGLAAAWSTDLARSQSAATAASGRARTHDGQAPGPPVLVVCGSRSPASLSQIAHLGEAGVPIVPVSDDLGAPRGTSRVIAELESGLGARRAAVLVPSVDAPASAGGAARPTIGHDDQDARGTAIGLVDALADVVVAVMARRQTRTLVLVGGMTAAAVLRALNVRVLEPIEHHDFAVRSSARAGASANGADGRISIVTKGGSSGSESVLTSTVARLLDGRGLADARK